MCNVGNERGIVEGGTRESLRQGCSDVARRGVGVEGYRLGAKLGCEVYNDLYEWRSGKYNVGGRTVEAQDGRYSSMLTGWARREFQKWYGFGTRRYFRN